jgi:drug/metabolite transporter (DMT)-like permease
MAYFGIALSGMLGFFFMTKSLQMIDPTVVAFIRALEIIFGYVFQVFVMQQIPTVLSLVGTGLVLISIIAISLQNILIVHIPENIRFLF